MSSSDPTWEDSESLDSVLPMLVISLWHRVMSVVLFFRKGDSRLSGLHRHIPVFEWINMVKLLTFDY